MESAGGMASEDGAAGEARAHFGALVAAHAVAIEAIARKLCRTASEANDLVQDTYERALRGISSLKSEERARAWLIQILRNCFLDGCRHRRREVLRAAVPDSVASTVEPPPRWERITTNDLRAAIGLLAEPFRSVAILHDVDGCSYTEIAARLGIPYATAATRLHRAHARIKGHLARKLVRDEDER